VTRGKPAILLQHGLLGCSTNYLDNLRNQSLAYILADAGFDVWLGNVRGNGYSRQHLDLDPDQKHGRYWQFTWDEFAKYDLPAMVDYIRFVTGNQQIFYVGHSQGTLIAFAQLSIDPEFAKKIKVFFALAPVANVTSAHSVLDVLLPHQDQVELFFNAVGHDEFLPTDYIGRRIAKKRCSSDNMTAADQIICKNLFMLAFNVYDAPNLNHTRVPVYAAHNPAGTSSRNMFHYGQMMSSTKMQMYDFGEFMNRKKYGQKDPPVYPVEKMRTPVVFFTGGRDVLADPADVEWLKQHLPEGTLIGDFHEADYEHCDFIWAPSAADKVYPHIIEIARKYM
jgi:lysosomal acid lipase/cholesteryl ester hydrolase